jgi:hypothetical protein
LSNCGAPSEFCRADVLREEINSGQDFLDYLCFVLYFQAEPGRTSRRT